MRTVHIPANSHAFLTLPSPAAAKFSLSCQNSRYFHLENLVLIYLTIVANEMARPSHPTNPSTINACIHEHSHQVRNGGDLDSKIHQRTWQADVKAVLHQLRQGPSLEDAQLQNLHITLRAPSPIPASQLVRDHLPAFLKTELGGEMTWNLDYRRRSVIEYPEDWPLRITSPSTGGYITESIYGLGDQIWGRGKYKYKMSESHLIRSKSPH